MLTYGLVADLVLREKNSDSISALQKIVRAWLSAKESKADAASRSYRHSEKTYRAAALSVWEFILTQSADSEGTWITEVRALFPVGDASRLKLTVAMRISPLTELGGPARYYVETPWFVRRLNDYFVVSVGGTEATAIPCEVSSDANVSELVQYLLSPGRSLPLVLVADPAHEISPIPDLPVRLANFLFGVAEVVHINAATSYYLTDKVGKEMSCFDGGVRIYWPGWSPHDSPLRHPLMLGKRVAVSAAHDSTDPDGLVRSPLMSMITRGLLSKFSYPQEMLEVVAEDQARKISSQSDDEKIAELQKENARLKLELADQSGYRQLAEIEISDLRAGRDKLAHELDLARMQYARSEKAGVDDIEEGTSLAEEDSPWAISALEDALAKAKHDFGTTLVFSDTLVSDTDLSAGLVYHVLMSLHRLCEKERKGLAKNKRALLQQLLVENAGISKDTYKVGDTGLTVYDPISKKTVNVRERVHINEGKPAESESVYWQTIGTKQAEYKYLVVRIGKHA